MASRMWSRPNISFGLLAALKALRRLGAHSPEGESGSLPNRSRLSIHLHRRSMPRPKPAWGTEPYSRKSVPIGQSLKYN